MSSLDHWAIHSCFSSALFLFLSHAYCRATPSKLAFLVGTLPLFLSTVCYGIRSLTFAFSVATLSPIPLNCLLWNHSTDAFSLFYCMLSLLVLDFICIHRLTFSLPACTYIHCLLGLLVLKFFLSHRWAFSLPRLILGSGPPSVPLNCLLQSKMIDSRLLSSYPPPISLNCLLWSHYIDTFSLF